MHHQLSGRSNHATAEFAIPPGLALIVPAEEDPLLGVTWMVPSAPPTLAQ